MPEVPQWPKAPPALLEASDESEDSHNEETEQHFMAYDDVHPEVRRECVELGAQLVGLLKSDGSIDPANLAQLHGIYMALSEKMMKKPDASSKLMPKEAKGDG